MATWPSIGKNRGCPVRYTQGRQHRSRWHLSDPWEPGGPAVVSCRGGRAAPEEAGQAAESWRMEMLAQRETLASLITEDPFCAQEGVKTLESKRHHERLTQIEQDLRLHLRRQDLACELTSDLLIRNVPLQEGLAPDIAIWPGHQVLDPEVDYQSLVLSAELCPALVLEVASKSTVEADRETKYEIYQLAGIAEYWLYDPLGYAGGPPLQGWRLTGMAYAPIEGQRGMVAGQEVWLYPSAILETAWGLEHDIELRLRDPVRADWYRMTPDALDQAETEVKQERVLVEQERVRADQAETEVKQERVLVEQERVRADRAEALVEQERVFVEQERARAEQAEARAEQAEARAEQEQARARQREYLLQQEMQRLRARLGEHADRD